MIASSLPLLVALVMAAPLLATAAAEPGEENIQRALAAGLEQPPLAPERGEESSGPFNRLIIRNAIVVDGAGAPPRGPLTIQIENDRIVAIGGGHGGAADERGAEVIDAAGGYVLPGFIDAHFHLGTPSHAYAGALTDPEYALKLQLAHGITTSRDVGAMMGLEWTIRHRELAEQGKITAEAFDDSPYAQFKHAMTRAVGPNETVEVDTLDFDMIPGQRLLLSCTW